MKNLTILFLTTSLDLILIACVSNSAETSADQSETMYSSETA